MQCGDACTGAPPSRLTISKYFAGVLVVQPHRHDIVRAILKLMRRPLNRAYGDQDEKLMFLDDRDAQAGNEVPLPWNTPPSNQGSAECSWCWRFIYAPALPCSVELVAGLPGLPTSSGLGDRCKWELVTRVPPGGAIVGTPL